MREKLTAQRVESIKPGAKRADFWDSALPGFSLRVAESGAKSWSCVYRHQGRVRRYTIGSYPKISLADARDAARKVLKKVALGDDPAGAKQAARAADSFGELFELYMSRHAVNKRTGKVDRQKYDRNLKQWAHRQAASITKRDVIDLLDQITDRGAPIQANRIHALISKIFNFGIKRDRVELNPAHGVEREPENTRGRILSDAEIRTFWEALENEPADFRDASRIMLLTGQRKQEVFGMLWAELDLDGATWTIDASRAKNKNTHLVPLAPQALAILKARRESANGHPAVFPGRKPGAAKCTIWRQMDHIRKYAKLENFWLEDLRGTVISGLTAIDTPWRVVQKIVNHADRDVTGVHYDRNDYLKQKREALYRWDRQLERLVTGRAAPDKVVSLRG